MGFFKTLVNNILGTRKEYAVKDLGIFTCKVCEWWQNEHSAWWSAVQLPLYSKETTIWLEGNALAPSPQQLSDLQTMLKNWKSVILRIESILPNESRLAHKEEIYTSWQDKFYPEDISAMDNNSWEITFVRDDLDNYFSFIWNSKNNTISDFTLN